VVLTFNETRGGGVVSLHIQFYCNFDHFFLCQQSGATEMKVDVVNGRQKSSSCDGVYAAYAYYQLLSLANVYLCLANV